MANYIYTNGELVNTDYLAHYGVMGMKWGVRKVDRESRKAGRDAWRKTTEENGGKLIGKTKSIAVYKSPAAKLKGGKQAKAAYKDAYKKYRASQYDMIRYGYRGADRIAKRRSKGDSLKTARRKETGRQLTTALLASAAMITIASGQATKWCTKGANAVKNVFRSKIAYEVLDASGKVIARKFKW